VSYSNVLIDGSSLVEESPDFEVKDGVAEVVAGNDYVVMEGFSTKDASEKSASEIVNKLMEELETMSGKASLSGDSNTASAVGLVESSHSVAPENESWALVPITNHGSSSPSRAIRTVGCASPNGFQVLQDIREEGEIDEEDNDKKDADETGILTNSMGESSAMVETAVNFSEGEVAAGSTLKQGSIQRGKGKGSKRVILNSRDLVHAVAQQQKEALMSSIFAWNMCGFNMPRKQKAVRHWVTAAKLSVGCLLETRVQEENFTKVFDATFPGWSCLHNYSSHWLGRIWVCWSDAVEIVPVSTSAQMITVWVRYKAIGDTFLCSFAYASNCMIERRELRREMETISETVVGDVNAWIIQGDFNLLILAMSRVWNETAPLFHSHSALRRFQDKLKALKSEMRALNRDMFGDLPGRVKQAYADLILTSPADIKLEAAAHFESFLNSTPQ
ncbi:hypothetical protein HID58_018417, partial [Brassica napus]